MRLWSAALTTAAVLAGCDPETGVEGRIHLGADVDPTNYTTLKIQAGPRANDGTFDPLFYDVAYAVQDARVVSDDLDEAQSFPFRFRQSHLGGSDRAEWRVRAWLATDDRGGPDGAAPTAEADYELGYCWVVLTWCGVANVDLTLRGGR